MSAPRVHPRVAIGAAGAVSALGLSWRGLGRAVLQGARAFSISSELAPTHPNTFASEVPPIPPASDAGDARQRKLMARAARFAAIAVRFALADAGASPDLRSEAGFYLGVGASGGAVADLEAVLRASVEGDRISLARLGEEGLSATNPVATFQLLNNFTLCHAAILSGLGGPSGAFFSRGGGTVFALMAAVFAVHEGDCPLAIVGGADSALHAVTWAELAREGFAARGLVPGEAAAILSLVSESINSIGFVEHAAVHSGEAGLDAALRDVLPSIHGLAPDLVVFAPWGDPPRTSIRSFLAEALPGVPSFDASLAFGDALAASPALAWLAALDVVSPDPRSPADLSPQLGHARPRRALVLSAGIDEQLGAVVLSGPAVPPAPDGTSISSSRSGDRS